MVYHPGASSLIVLNGYLDIGNGKLGENHDILIFNLASRVWSSQPVANQGYTENIRVWDGKTI